jgi:hypothetical protein
MKHPSQLKAEQIRNRHLARQFPHVGQIIAERDAYKKALEDAGIPLPEADTKDITKPAVSAPAEAPAEPVEESPTEPAATGEGWEETAPDAAPKKTAKKTAKK